MMINQEALMAFLANPNPEMMNQIADQMVAEGVPPPPPGSLQQAKAMLAQQGGGVNFGGNAPAPTAAPAANMSFGAMLGGGQPGNPVDPGFGNLLQGQYAGPTGAPGGVYMTQPQQPTVEDKMAELGRAAAALNLDRQKGQGQGQLYFNPPRVGAAQLARGIQTPRAMTPPSAIPSLGQFL